MEELMKMIADYGYGVLFTAYFIIKDWKQSSKMLDLMTQFNTTLTLIKDKLVIDKE